ncbi:hypothetical protein B296_00011923 [Ensete ventricosum]|uniref:heme oxygenase (biliverdin-producing) n=1 Tax=Ensete ventricosum TaxID=4639 RepID=A0A426ZUJ4_ENSVE|nr:hypothetical protein B296_00011923 [Ensete ventricosum]
MAVPLELRGCYPHYPAYTSSIVAEKILDNKELQFYKWDSDLSQLLQNVRDKLNRVATLFVVAVRMQCMGFLLSCFATLTLQSWSREEKDHCLEETEKSFKYSGEILALILSEQLKKNPSAC